MTASCAVFSPGFDAVLLHLHRKAGVWLQFGGHIESADAGARAAARRETGEESGLAELAWLSPLPVDVHRHALAGRFGSCAEHTDIVFAATADPAAATRRSAESAGLAWSALAELPDGIAADLPARLPAIAARARRLARG
ncbi:NUDIX domain-containing protein [Brevibacterium sp. BRM-1]|uniref:NUDIX domain-containing protein n=1 Tax=Brevibacterium sp. BRM-1 TaxID=2999062 RepID=UPI002280615C|nr:NUDIX domain-containing protein [Brevibacterium sp. BRM-1]WAL40502.1 NUDIX domain-containing protein [Brevibacterium sp. BRM-1]